MNSFKKPKKMRFWYCNFNHSKTSNVLIYKSKIIVRREICLLNNVLESVQQKPQNSAQWPTSTIVHSLDFTYKFNVKNMTEKQCAHTHTHFCEIICDIWVDDHKMRWELNSNFLHYYNVNYKRDALLWKFLFFRINL